jgi:hypothetical protein
MALHGPFITFGLVPNNEVCVMPAAGKRLSKDFERIRALCEKDNPILLLLDAQASFISLLIQVSQRLRVELLGQGLTLFGGSQCIDAKHSEHVDLTWVWHAFRLFLDPCSNSRSHFPMTPWVISQAACAALTRRMFNRLRIWS